MRLNAYRGLTKTMESGTPGPEGSLGKWQWADINQDDHRAGARDRGRLRAAHPRFRARRRRRALAVRVPALARKLDRGRDHRHPQEHHRRASARPAEAALGPVYFDLNDEQQAIKSTAREFLASRYKPRADPRAGRDRPRLRGVRLEGDGRARLDRRSALPEEHGAGRASASSSSRSSSRRWATRSRPSPLLSNTIAGLALCALRHRTSRRTSSLRPLAAARARGTAALFDAGSTGTIGEFAMEAQADGDGVILDGEKVLVHGCRRRRLLARRHLRRAPPPGRARRRRRLDRRPSPRSTRPAASTRSASTASRSAPRTRTLPSAGQDFLPVLAPVAVALAAEADRDRPAHAGDGGRVRQGPPAVRPPDRLLPGGLAPLRADAAGDRERALRRLLRRLGRRRRARDAAAGRLDGQGLRLRRRLAGRRRRRSRCTAASASPGSTTCTSS